MLHIKPIPEQEASDAIRGVFMDINVTFGTPIVPLLFRYLANYPEYLLYVWQKIKTNVQSPYFQQSWQTLNNFTMQHLQEIYQLSQHMRQFLTAIPPEEKQILHTTVTELQRVNAQLMILTLGIREGVKGVFVTQQQLPYTLNQGNSAEIFEAFAEKTTTTESPEMATVTKMLAPLFGSSSIMIVRYPEFFARVAGEMEILVKEESYLTKRVLLEKAGLQVIAGLQYPLGTSYAEIAHFAAGKPYFSELLYILSETFPSQFPRLVITTQLMQMGLQQGSSIVTQQ